LTHDGALAEAFGEQALDLSVAGLPLLQGRGKITVITTSGAVVFGLALDAAIAAESLATAAPT